MREQETTPPRRERRGTVRRMVAVGLIASALGIALGLTIHWFPPADSTQADKIDTLWDVLVIASVPVFVLVTVVVIFSALEFRMRAGEENLDGPPIHGSTRLEVVWTAIPAIVILCLVGYSGLVLHDIEKAPAKGTPERVINVTGQQFAWTFQYKEAGQTFSTTQLYLPAGQSVKFEVHSKDVIHDFWVPDFRMKIDAVPGITTSYRVTPKDSAVGDHEIVCAELCGLGHAYMRSTVHVLRPDAFDAWVRRTSSGGAAGAAGAAGGAAAGGQPAAGGKVDAKALFASGDPNTGATACGSCHALAAAGTTGTTGPDLGKVLKGKSTASITESIVKPSAQIAPGYQDGIMPPNYGATLSKQQIGALVQYLAKSTSK
ncbi:MAG: cytochrome c oxidase subunit II [Solirubrobacteraceae bacterium]